ncbi:hypothetical protein L7F22_002455 [Adiantum nelumboides]|nr:hypothetical protein [Adiantum nelumboides]
MLVLLFAFMVLLAGLVLASTILFLKSKHHNNTHSRSLSQKVQSEAPFSAISSCQTCHLCGGLRLRTQNADSFDSSSVSKSRRQRMSGKFGPIQHQWGSMRTQILLSIKQAVQKLISHHKKQGHVDFFTKLASSSFLLKCKAKPQSKDVCVVSTALPSSEGISQCLPDSSLGTCIDSTVSNCIAVAATNEFDKVDSPDIHRSTESEPRDAPVHRVVLEILVSSSKEKSCAISPGITLKLETSAAPGSLAGHLESLKDIDTNSFEHTSDITQMLHGANDALPKTLGSGCAHGEQNLYQMLNEAILLSKDEMKFRGRVTAKSEIADKNPMLSSIQPNKGFQTLAGLKDCPQCCHTLEDNMELEVSESVGKSFPLCDQLKHRSSNALRESTASNVARQRKVDKRKGSEMASEVSLSNLGSLHVSFLKSSEQEANTDVNCQVGSMLALLNVTDKFTGDKSLRGVKKEMPNKILPCDLLDTGCRHRSAFLHVAEGEGVCDESLVKKEDLCPLQGSMDTSSSKKKKKKKKAKGKKSNVKLDDSVVDTGTMQEVGKVALEAAKHVSAVPKWELGCVCGATKGNLHKESCPYPFISSSSMLQRKMRQHYIDLVKSNAAKTLTLAQVGQFTSCLVEAKANLKQKSDSIQRKYTITKSLLSKAEKSSFDRLCSQIYGLEMEQKKLEEDTIVYNRLQEQLKLSPAYQKNTKRKRPIFIGRDTPSLRARFSPLDSVSDVLTEDRVVYQLMFAIEALLESIRVPVQDLEELCEQSEDCMGRLVWLPDQSCWYLPLLRPDWPHPPSVVMWSIRDASAIFGTQEDRLRIGLMRWSVASVEDFQYLGYDHQQSRYSTWLFGLMMLEYGRAHFELQPHTGQIMEKLDPEDSEISFEEFLEQEKKDAFWQRRNLARSPLSAC